MPQNKPSVSTLWKIVLGAFAFAACAALMLALREWGVHGLIQTIKESYKTLIPLGIRKYISMSVDILASPWSYAVIIIAVLLENIAPVKRDLKRFLPSMTHDFIWFQADTIFQTVFMPLFVALLKLFYDTYLSFLTIQAMYELHPAIRCALSILAFDFAQYAYHVARHKMTSLWHFHAVHHSSRYLSIFTDLRVHPVERIINQAVTFIPFFMLGIQPFAIVAVSLVILWYTRIYHANIRTNYGFFKYFMVTPQSHRIHHSIEPRHRDRNYGVLFTVWDRMFGTLYPGYDEYPETGIEDKEFPLETELSFGLFRTFLAQLIYPFRMNLRRAA